ncbi:MAG: tripartite tricarboxylate transporter substrate binding protein [Xanthobacteraceae bacterium]|nr:tripartite tricarboxylate transporter substrate binding protein [Xanthobacteraceae bacterium]
MRTPINPPPVPGEQTSNRTFSRGGGCRHRRSSAAIIAQNLGRIKVMITSIRAFAAFAIGSVITVLCAGQLQAQNYPSRSVTIVVPSAPGGGTDTVARLIGDQLGKQLSESFVVDNRTGGGMNVGTAAAAKAAPDGHTLLMGLNGNMAVNPSLFAKLPYDPLADFTPVAMLAEYPFLVVVSNDLPVTSIKELIAYLKANAGKVNYASAGTGTGQHLAPELFKMVTGTDMSPVHYRGAQPAYQDVIAGRLPIFFDNMSTAMSLAKGGKVRALAITSKKRSALMPELPTVEEAGVPGYEYHTWFGLWAPKQTPPAIIEKLHAEVRKALADPTIQQRIAATAGEPSAMPLKDIDPFVKAEVVKWAEVVKRAGIKIE